MSSDQDIVTLRRFGDEQAAELAASVLREVGIYASLADQHTAGTAAVFAGVTEIRLMVRAGDLERAQVALDEFAKAEVMITEEELVRQALSSSGGDWGEDDDDEEHLPHGPLFLVCPECGGRHIVYNSRFVFSCYGLALVFAIIVSVITATEASALYYLLLVPPAGVVVWGLLNLGRFLRRCRACGFKDKLEVFLDSSR